MDFPKPYNSYNLYYILERALLLEARNIGSYAQCRSSSPPAQSGALFGYEFINLPPLPKRYQHLQPTLPPNWFNPGRKLTKRKHTKTHGAISFRELSTTVARNWRAIAPEIKSYVNAVALLLRRRYKDVLKMGGLGCLNVAMEAVPSTTAAGRQRDIQKQDRKHTIKTGPYEEVIQRRPYHGSIISSSPTVVADTPFQLCKYLKAEPDKIAASDPGILDALHLSEISSGITVLEQIAATGLNKNLEFGDGKGRSYQEVDVSDSEILQFYHSSGI